MEQNPYTETREDNLIVRTFSQNVEEEQLVWHRDKNDREITVIGNTDWMFQFDNQLPQSFKGVIFIPKNTYHRIIKGTGTITLKILEH